MYAIRSYYEANNRKMNDTYSHFQSWNDDQSENILNDRGYWQDFSILTPEVKQPVLFFYGKTDKHHDHARNRSADVGKKRQQVV